MIIFFIFEVILNRIIILPLNDGKSILFSITVEGTFLLLEVK